MLFYIITWAIIYFILILVIHNLYLFFQKNLTSVKTKDYYNFPNKEYNKINNILNSKSEIKIDENKILNNVTNNTSKQILESKFNTFSNIDFSLKSETTYNNDAKIFPNYDVNLTSNNIETKIETKIETNLETNLETNNSNNFNIEQFNSRFENNNMKGELEEFLNKLNN